MEDLEGKAENVWRAMRVFVVSERPFVMYV